MALPSQSARPTARRSHMYRRSRRRSSLRAVVIIALLVGGGAFTAWKLELIPDFRAASNDQVAAQDDAAGDGDHQLNAPPPQQPDPASSGTQANADDAATNTPPPVTPDNDTRTPPAEVEAQTVAIPEPRNPRPNSRAATLAQEGLDLRASDPVRARSLLSQALMLGELGPTDSETVRSTLQEISDELVFGGTALQGDPYVKRYTIKGGDTLERIARRQGILTDWRFIQRVNRIARPSAIREGQELKIVTGPFHAIVDKSDYRLDLYLGEEDEDPVFVRSFRVGLGENNGTPVGRFRIRPKSKLINPVWRNPRTGELFEANDPKNPIGEHWLGLEPIEDHLSALTGYGLHGTIDPDSIGQQASMGCVRMGDDDIELIWEVLIGGVSTVEIRK